MPNVFSEMFNIKAPGKSKVSPGSTKNETNVEMLPPDGVMKDYLKDAFGGVTGAVRFPNKDTAVIEYTPNTLLSFKGSSKFLLRNQARVETDYSFVQVERLYEKEGLIRKFVSTAAAKFHRAAFRFAVNPDFDGKADAAYKKVIQDHNRILKDSGVSWGEVIQTVGKEIHQFGNSMVLKRRNADQTIRKLVLDDLFFYDCIVSMPDMEIDQYIRRPFTRPKPHSEDLYNLAIQAMNLNSKTVGSGFSFRSAAEYSGFYGPGFFGTNYVGYYGDEYIVKADVMHFRYMKEKNAPFSMPPIMALVNDINDLRVLEENMVALGFQYGHPLLHVGVDLTGLNEADGRRALNEATAAVENMLSVGALVTSKRIEPKLLYPNGTMVPLDKFLNYLNDRIEKELDTSGLLVGNGSGAGRQAGESIEAAANDIFQMMVELASEKLEREYFLDIHNGLKGEGNISPVRVEVEEIDRGRKAFRVNTLSNGANLGLVERDEWRKENDLPPVTNDQKTKIQDYLSSRGGKGDGGSFKTVNPTNQHGETTPGTTKD